MYRIIIIPTMMPAIILPLNPSELFWGLTVTGILADTELSSCAETVSFPLPSPEA